MISFEYTLTDPMGLHARPAGQLAKEAKKFKSQITVSFGGKSVNVLRMMSVMGLGTKGGETVKVTIDGEDENNAAEEIKVFLERTV